MTTRVFMLVTGGRATRENNGLPFALQQRLPDDSGDVVIDSRAGDVTVLTDDPVIAHGIERDYVTSAGDDVSGYAYCRFGDGITVFYPRSHSLCVKENKPI
jgi:hypothetical protein